MTIQSIQNTLTRRKSTQPLPESHGVGFNVEVAPTILSIATAVPPFALAQKDVASIAPQLFDVGKSEIARLMPVFNHAGIDRRYSCVPLDWYREPHGWEERNSLYLQHAVSLLKRAAAEALLKAGRRKEDIAAVVTVSTTGIATPALDAMLMNELGLSPTIRRLPIFGLGCAGGTVGLSHAADIARAHPEGDTLFLVVELCALTFRQGDMSNSNIVASALFGDGAAALVLGRPGSAGPRLTASGMHTWPDSLDVMGWRVANDGLGVLFSRDIPTLVRQDMRPAAESFLAQHDLTLSDIDGFICHPGGMKVLDALEDIFDLSRGEMSAARNVLRNYGNMSAVTVIFVMQQMMQVGLSGRYLMSSLGPGFSAGFQVLEI
jgi:alkylresorcinol/alkylpyrone synthase